MRKKWSNGKWTSYEVPPTRRDLTKEDHRYCQIEDYFPFPKEVPYREESRIYLERTTLSRSSF